VEKLDLHEWEVGYSEEGHPAYHPALLLKVWLYAYALGMTSSRRLEQRVREDNGLLVPMVDRVQRGCGQPPGQVSADSGFFW
jgi:hypothetical protein